VSVLTKVEAQKLMKAREVVIPNGYRVIDDEAFRRSDVKSVLIPEGVVSIGRSAFERNVRLKEVVLPESVTEIEAFAFKDCKNLRAIAIPRGVTEIEQETFMRCELLSDVSLPDTVTAIRRRAFYGCAELKSIYLSENVAHIDPDAFKGCANLTVYSPRDSYAHTFCRKRFFGRINWAEAPPASHADREPKPETVNGLPPPESADKGFMDFIREIEGFKHHIKDPRIVVRLNELDATCRLIVKFVTEHPESEKQIDKKVLDYYLPTTLKLTKTYVDLSRQRAPIAEIEKIIENIYPSIVGVLTLMKIQLENLYKTKSIDVSSDMDVLKYVLAKDGVEKK
jgi:hypothetical protein